MLPSILKKRHKIAVIWPTLLAGLLAAWPFSAVAGIVVDDLITGAGFQAPFLFSWFTIWFFAIGGGIMSNFVKLDVDKEFRAVYIAKPFIGILFSMSTVMYFNGEADPPGAGLAIAALGAAFVGAPLMQGLLIYMTKTDFIPKLLESLHKRLLGGK